MSWLGALVASPAQLARQGRPGTWADLLTLDTVSMSTAGETATWQLLAPDGAAHSFQHQPRYVADGRLVQVMPGWAPRPGIFHAVFPSRRGLLPAVWRLLDYLGDAITREGLAQVPTDIALPPQLLSIK